jgi:CheY-like chemotaxis protein
VIFLDLEMPGIDGYPMLSYLKNDDRFNNVPVVAYTVHMSEMNVARQKGFHSFLGKPLDADLFPEQLAAILRGEHVWTKV